MASKESGRRILRAATEQERRLAAALAELQAEQEWAIWEQQEAEAVGLPALQRLPLRGTGPVHIPGPQRPCLRNHRRKK